jgi:hypothetical protein
MSKTKNIISKSETTLTSLKNLSGNINKINHQNMKVNKLNNRKTQYINIDSSHKIHIPRKESIPKRIRELVWNTYNGEYYNSKCYVKWCNNMINVFNYQVGHDIPESKGGKLEIENLKPICGNCNLSMGNKYSITEWSNLIQCDNNFKLPEKNYIPEAMNISNKDNLTEFELSNSFRKSIIKTMKKSKKELEKITNNNHYKQTTDMITDNNNGYNNMNMYDDNKYKIITSLGLLIMIINYIL